MEQTQTIPEICNLYRFGIYKHSKYSKQTVPHHAHLKGYVFASAHPH